MELLSQFGSIVSEPIHSWDSSKHHVVAVEFVPELLVAEVEEFQPAEFEIEEFQPAELESEVLYFELELDESKLELHSRQRSENSVVKEDRRPEYLPRLQARNIETIIIPPRHRIDFHQFAIYSDTLPVTPPLNIGIPLPCRLCAI